jgi:crotonobetainyl-CoA:carnitine CoA-transferase CaiB-like acyl-CoA transferase
VSAEFERVGAALAPIYDVEQLMSDPQVLARDTITSVDDEYLGPLKMQNLIFRMGATPGAIRFPGRRLGQDNETFFGEALRLSPDEIPR